MARRKKEEFSHRLEMIKTRPFCWCTFTARNDLVMAVRLMAGVAEVRAEYNVCTIASLIACRCRFDPSMTEADETRSISQSGKNFGTLL